VRSRRRQPCAVLAAVLVASVSAPARAPGADAASPRLVDRVVAVVDEDPILASDVDRAVALGLVERAAGEPDDELRRRALDGLIEQRLRLHEIARFGLEEASIAEVDRQFEQLRAGFADEGAWRAELGRLGLDEAGVRQLLARQLSILAYVEERLGPRIFVGVEEIRRHYDEELVPALAAEGRPAPPIEEVRESIRAVLRERRLNEEIERWTADLRAAADVVDLLDVPERPLPPVRFEVPPRDD
jgi:hypothetical protein